MKDTYKKNEMNNTIFSNGIKEILQFLIDKEVKSFTQIKKIKNLKTNKVFSANTIALRLKSLEKNNLIERKMVKNEDRWLVGYAVTEKGIKILKVYDQINEDINKILHE